MTLITEQRRFLCRAGTSSDLTVVNEVLLDRELCFESDTLKAKLGDGTTAWNSLPYLPGGGGGGGAWLVGTGTPSSGLGANGDFYLDAATGDVYEKAAGAWAIVANIMGPIGADGDDGADGATWTVGTGAPSGGADGDLYLESVTGDVYQKAAGTWSVVANIKGPSGGGGGGSGGRDVASISIGSGGQHTGDLAVGMTAVLLRVQATGPMRLRLYSTTALAAADASRPSTTDSVTGDGLLFEFITDVFLTAAALSPKVIVSNDETSPVATIPYIVDCAAAVDVDITFIEMES